MISYSVKLTVLNETLNICVLRRSWIEVFQELIGVLQEACGSVPECSIVIRKTKDVITDDIIN